MPHDNFYEEINRNSTKNMVFRLSDDKTAVKVGLSLLFLAISLISLHILTNQFSKENIRFGNIILSIHNVIDIGRENSFSERLNHGILFVSAILLLGLCFEARSYLPLFLSAFIGFAWLDDSSMYHERMGSFISETWVLPSAFGLQPQDIGELLAWGLAALILLPLAIWAYIRRRPGDDVVLRLMAFPLLALIFCAVAFDAMHVVVQAPWADQLFLVLEDGGEMLASAAIAAVSLALLRNVPKIYGTTEQPAQISAPGSGD